MKPALTRAEVAELFKKTGNTVRNWCNPKHSNYNPDFPKPFTNNGRHAMWKAEDIERYMSRGRAA